MTSYGNGLEPRDLLDAEIATALGDMPTAEIGPDTVEQYRAPSLPVLSEHVERNEHVVPGEPDVRIRVHRPRGDHGLLPCLYSMHGGGYVLGSYDMDDAMFARSCPGVGMVGVSVDYRLAPETPYPGPLEDCYRGLKWVFEHAEELGVDRSLIGVRGLSAGGGLAAGLTLLARERAELEIAFQLLESPMLDDRRATFSSQIDGLPVWTKTSNEFGWKAYLGDLSEADEVPATAAPARETDLAGLPPAFVSVGSIDGFLDEDVDYALRLIHAGVPCELHVYPGAPHGYQIAVGSAIVERSDRDIADWLHTQVGRPVRGRRSSTRTRGFHV